MRFILWVLFLPFWIWLLIGSTYVKTALGKIIRGVCFYLYGAALLLSCGYLFMTAILKIIGD